MEKFGLYGKLIAKEGQRGMLADILLEAARSMNTMKDCEIYYVSISEDDPNAVFVYEVWANESAHKASLTQEAAQTLIAKAKPVIAGMERIHTLVPLGGKASGKID
ncbi:antibiotic biosynthesis monooxygenase [Metabacillus sp. GX 13764]|uniref:putative quinol monooxygenase n=1 Tax=Metabacillus kandeliae TaxID=2900151 RepID=UPI001E59659D|nr:putative quinol monooxygenase [Metabacillus kandeliae]MCD7034006.1 antibiotic biosynthesis monooxygenase [Metabacillus kandeliae]